ncbi:DNA packaging terminase subunit 2 [pteropodid alphaherpesvirus 2]|uniref:DNA packaging terminase subunit 2 n=1 Tax=pteropodid alphaherpesvirus 2 TaxID=3118716 RepID=A0A510J6P1_9ALPH|nr:DNA packaging terminase subunit 2 [pteropodid alphaherpesvirus 2]BBM13200.1 DNA packaging terminase subunit 2 [pteropodid alphaherpesvirus 2]
MASPAAPPVSEATVARQKLLALLGQVQAYVFQLELLKRCDPQVGLTKLAPLKLNALSVRAVQRQLSAGLQAQSGSALTPLSVTLDLLLAYARAEGERVLTALETFRDHASPQTFFAETMGLNKPCPFHQPIHLETYGGDVTMEICFLHDVENFLKQLNYCHLITPPQKAAEALLGVREFLINAIGSGLIVAPELSDPSHPCSVCFEELCVTANQGTAIARRLADKICNHVTQQAHVRFDSNELQRYLPHATGIPESRRERALRVLDEVLARIATNQSSVEDRVDDTTQKRADAALEAHHVFKAATPGLYAISELRFWLASGDRARQATTMDAFASNLNALAQREMHHEMVTAAVELALFDKNYEHFDRAFGERLGALDMVDALIIGGQATSPDDQIEALIRACYDHHLSTPLLRRLVHPEQCDEEALRRVLARFSGTSTSAGETDAEGGDDGNGGSEGGSTPNSGAPPEQRRDQAEAPDDWAAVAARAQADMRERRRLYADRLTKKSIASLGRCVREQRGELEKMLRVSVHGEVLPTTFASVANGFAVRAQFCQLTARAGTVIDNRHLPGVFDAHRFMRASLLRHSVDSALLPSITHRFFELVNGPLFDHATHSFAQPPNTALYYSVENVGLLPHLKEELARFIAGSSGGGTDWAVSEFQKFYSFDGISGITPTQRAAWRYIRELIIATTLFTAVYRCGEIELRRPDYSCPATDGQYRYPIGLYLTYDTECPLVAIVEAGPGGVIGPQTVVIYDRDVFSILYSVLQYLAPKRAGGDGRAGTNAESL